MRISGFKILTADGLWRPFSFLKLTTDEGLVGWSEFVQSSWAPGLKNVIEALYPQIAGRDPRHYARLSAELHALTRFTSGGLAAQAVATFENACVDLAAKAAGVPVHQLLGGPFRNQVELYWSHCGSFRVGQAEKFERVLGLPALRSLADVEQLGVEARRRGFHAVKTNPIEFHANGPQLLNPGFAPAGLQFEQRISDVTLAQVRAQAEALRSGLGADHGLMIDFNFGFKPESLLRLTRELKAVKPAWLEMDLATPEALADVRRGARAPIASLEAQYGSASYLPWLRAKAVDVAIVDVPWNGIAESLRIANLAQAHEVNVAPHNFYGPLADLMAAQFCAAAGNVAIMEIEADDVPWKYDLLTVKPKIVDGRFEIPLGPGWGADINEDAVEHHPYRVP